MTLKDKLLIGLLRADEQNEVNGGTYSMTDILADTKALACRNVADEAMMDGFIELPNGMTKVPKVRLSEKGKLYASNLIAEAEKLK